MTDFIDNNNVILSNIEQLLTKNYDRYIFIFVGLSDITEFISRPQWQRLVELGTRSISPGEWELPDRRRIRCVSLKGSYERTLREIAMSKALVVLAYKEEQIPCAYRPRVDLLERSLQGLQSQNKVEIVRVKSDGSN